MMNTLPPDSSEHFESHANTHSPSDALSPSAADSQKVTEQHAEPAISSSQQHCKSSDQSGSHAEMSHSDPNVQDETAPEPADFGSLARKIRSRVFDLLSIGLCAILLLTVGHHVRDWWTNSPNDPAKSSTIIHEALGTQTEWGAPGVPVEIQFGNHGFQLGREEFAGNREDAIARLAEILETKLPLSLSPEAPPTESEKKHLAKLNEETMLKSVPREWRIDFIKGPALLVLGSRWEEKSASDSGLPDNVNLDEINPKDRNETWRMTCWGLGFPEEDQHWVLFTGSHQAGFQPSARTEWPKIDLPAGAVKVLSLQSPNGNGLIHFKGTGTLEAWSDFFRTNLENQNWMLANDLSSSETTLVLRFRPNAELLRTSKGFIDVSISVKRPSNSTGLFELTGMLQLVPVLIKQ